jgi:hypothetical protein
MIVSMPYKGSMRYIPNQRASASEMRDLRRQAWREAGVLTVKPDDIPDELIRRILTELGEQLYGQRPGGD